MAYPQHAWTTGEVVTAEKLNNMEGGIAANDTAIPASATEASGTITFKNASGTTLFTVSLPIYDGSVIIS